ncbi:MAG: rhodanese-like domain-containing protein [Bacillota bacterium]|nr:rhodanese-like domain-containing protein [Bacillota bacterium]
MSFFDIFKSKSMFQEVKECLATPNALLLDVRSAGEYRTGHIPGSINVPLKSIHQVDNIAKSKDVLICVYCQSGIRATNAVTSLKGRGYTNVKNLGSIKKYRGMIER